MRRRRGLLGSPFAALVIKSGPPIGDGGGRNGTFGAQDREEAREQRRENSQDAESRVAEFKRDELPNLEWQMHRDGFLFGANKSGAFS